MNMDQTEFVSKVNIIKPYKTNPLTIFMLGLYQTGLI